MKRKNVDVELVDQNANGGRIVINTGAVDRDRDRVLPQGVKLDNYMKNPVVQWGHNYRDPWATVGETLNLEISDGGIVADFSLREPANESDPMHVIRALWEQGLIRTASVGFNPLEWEENEAGGYDFTAWELLEWSLVPVPANQEALRLAVKGLTHPTDTELSDEPLEGTFKYTLECDQCGAIYEVSASLWRMVFEGKALQLCENCVHDEVSDAPKSVDNNETGANNNDDNKLSPDEVSTVLAELTQALKQLKEKYDV
jgi:HK97 family phage prohead protease